MATKNIDFKEFQSLYETCGGSRDLKEFCKDSGVNYEKFIEWRRKQFRDSKTKQTSPMMAPVAIVDLPVESLPSPSDQKSKPIKFVEVKFSAGVSIRRFDVDVDDLVSQITKLSSALC